MSPPLQQRTYRSESTRAAWWNYANCAAYFVTINVKDRKRLFGEIRNKQMILSHIGVIADLCWQQTKQTSPDWEFIEYVIMPDHFHALVIKTAHTEDTDKLTEQHHLNQETGKHQRFRNPGKNTLSSLVGKYKSMVTRHARRLGYAFDWQPRFHDSIVKGKDGIQKVQHYIQHNVRNWRT